MSKPSAPPTSSIEPIPGESNTEYLLRLAAELILINSPDKRIYNHEYQEAVTGTELASDLTMLANRLADERLRPSMKFRGEIIQAGGSETPTVTIAASSKQELSKCDNIPFFKKADITITPTKY
jgi:hypothetical protein